jgi:hypothetical protein
MVLQEPTEWQHIGNQIDGVFVFARANLVNGQGMQSRWHINWLDRNVVINRFAAIRTKLQFGRYGEGSAPLLR